MGVLHADLAGLHAADAPGGIAQQNDVPRQALHREVFVHGPDLRAVRLGDHRVVERVRNGPARGKGRQAGAPPRAEPAVDPIVMEVRTASAPARGDPFGQHPNHRVELRALQLAVGKGAPAQGIEVVLPPLLGGHLRHDLLGQDVQGRGRHLDAIEHARPDRTHQCRAFDQLIAGGRKEPAFRLRADPVTRPAHPLQAGGDRPRRADLARQVHGADIDAELQRGSRHHHAGLAVFEAFFGRQADLPGQAAVMGGDDLRAQIVQALFKVVGHAFRQPSGVDEDQRGAVLPHEVGHPVVDVAPDRVRRHCSQFVLGHRHRQVHLAAMADVDDPAAHRSGRGEELCDGFNGSLGGREADAGRSGMRERVESL